jgi:glutamine synthetase
MVLAMKAVGIEVEAHHHEVATGGQNEIDMRFDTLVRMADKLMMYKYIVKNVARKHGKVGTFMPKPLFADNGSGMHTHQSLWKDGVNTFYDQSGYALTSQTCRQYIGGLLTHARALMAFCAPTTNSYKRLVPGYEAPVNLVYSARNRSAACRIPVISDNPKAKRVEFRPPDPLTNPYLAFPAMLLAGLDGIERGIDPGQPLEKNTYELSAEESAAMRTVPASLQESVDALEDDHDFLLKSGVFTADVIEKHVELLKDQIDQVRLRPHPWEFALYFGA